MIASVANVRGLEELAQLPARQPLLFGVGYLVVIGVARGKGLLKDRRVGCHPGKRIVTNTAVQLTIVQHPAIDAVEPDRLPDVVKFLQSVPGHGKSPL